MITYDTLKSALEGNITILENAGIDSNIIHELHELVNIYSFEPNPFYLELITQCIRTHAPVRALSHLAEFLERTEYDFNGNTFSESTAAIIADCFATSNVLSRRLTSDTALLDIVDSLPDPCATHVDKSYYMGMYSSLIDGIAIYSDRIKTIHRVHTSHMARLCSRNTRYGDDIQSINAELSVLADATIEICLNVIHSEMHKRLGIEYADHRMVVLGLGKLGGSELNVSSDIDLIYLCEDTESRWGQYDTIRYHTMLAERLTRTLSEMSELGILYRVDTRLRADGSSGPLVRTTTDYYRYLEMRGEAWERQMLLKARPVAGVSEIGEGFLHSLERFIYPTSITRSPHREIIALKSRIEARLEQKGNATSHLKLMAGGIRDIEFTVQCLQLLMGGIHPDVRSSGTLPAIDRLHDANALSNDEYATLKNAYRLYRKMENAYQWRELLASFSIPETDEERTAVASFLRYAQQAGNPGRQLVTDIRDYLSKVRAIYDDIFKAETAGSFEEMSVYAATHPASDDTVRRFLESLGFTDPEESARHLSRLSFGAMADPAEMDIHPSTKQFLPTLLKALSELPDPAGALYRFQRVVEAYHARTVLFGILNDNPRFFELLLTITHASIFISDIMAQDPSLLDWLVEEGELLQAFQRKEITDELKRLNRETRDDMGFSAACQAVKGREKLRIGARDLSGISSTHETFSELSNLAETILEATYERIKARAGASSFTFSIIGAGRLGARLMNFGSDLDLIFVYDALKSNERALSAPEQSAKFAQRIVRLLGGRGGASKVYEIDARLRPEGNNATLTVSFDEYERYLEHRASVWERLALVRSRPLCGDGALSDRMRKLIDDFVYSTPYSQEEIHEILRIRERMVEKALAKPDGGTNVKIGPGGIADIDFVAQTLAAHYGGEHPGIRHVETSMILQSLGDNGLLERQQASTLIEQYRFLNDIDKALRIGSGRSLNTIPVEDRETARIARLLGFKNVRRFKKRLDDSLTLVHEMYLKIMNSIPS